MSAAFSFSSDARPAMPKTYAQQLEEVQAAITAIETGAQSYSYENHSWTGADLKTLHAREERLRKLAAREARGGIRVRYGVPE